MSKKKRVGVLISGRGSNMAAVIDAAAEGRIEGAVTHVISNRPDAGGLLPERLAELTKEVSVYSDGDPISVRESIVPHRTPDT